MKLFKIIFVLLFLFASANTCFAQKNTIALVDTKSFYASENGVTRLVNALKTVNSNFLALTAEEKDKEFKRIAKKCRDKDSKTELEAKEETVCTVVKDITNRLEDFKKKQEFIILADVSSCSYVTHLCENAVDVTKQFITEYNSVENDGGIEQINGREGETATLLSRFSVNSELRVIGFAPRHLNRCAASRFSQAAKSKDV